MSNNRSRLNHLDDDIAGVELKIDQLFELQQTLERERAGCIFAMLEEEHILSKVLWDYDGQSGNKLGFIQSPSDTAEAKELWKEYAMLIQDTGLFYDALGVAFYPIFDEGVGLLIDYARFGEIADRFGLSISPASMDRLIKELEAALKNTSVLYGQVMHGIGLEEGEPW